MKTITKTEAAKLYIQARTVSGLSPEAFAAEYRFFTGELKAFGIPVTPTRFEQVLDDIVDAALHAWQRGVRA